MRNIVNLIFKCIKSLHGFWLMFVVVSVVPFICSFDLCLPYFTAISKELGIEILKIRTTDFITIFSSSIAIVAIVFSIIQIKDTNEDTITILFNETYLFPYLGISIGIIIQLIFIQSYSQSELFNNSFIVKISTLSICYIVFELFCITFIIYRVYKTLSSNFILDKSIENIKESLDKESKNINYQNLNITIKRLFDIYWTAIINTDGQTVNRINNMIFETYQKNNDFIFILDLSQEVFNKFEIAVNTQNREVCYKLIDIYIEFITKGVETNNIQLINKFSRLTKPIYVLFQSKNFYSYDLTKDIVNQLQSVYINKIKSQIDFEDKEINYNVFNQQSIIFLNQLNQLIKSILDYKEFTQWEYILNSLNQYWTNGKSESTIYKLKHNLRILINDNPLNPEAISKIKLEINNREKVKITINLMRFGIFAWIIDMYISGKISLDEYNKFQIKFELSNKPFNEIMDDLLFLTQYDFHGDTMGWNIWTFPPEQMLPFKTYNLPSTSQWLVIGFIFKLVESKILNSYSNEFVTRVVNAGEYSNIEYYINKALNELTNHSEILLNILNIKSDILEHSLFEIQSFFKDISKTYIELIEFEIAHLPISQSRVKDFKDKTFKDWQDNSIIENIFSYFTQIEVVHKCENLKKAEIYINVNNNRSMFTESKHQNTIDFNFGQSIASTVNDSFIEIILEKNKLKKVSVDFVNSIRNTIEELKRLSYNPDVIFLDSNMIYYDNFDTLLVNPNSNQKLINTLIESQYFIFEDIFVVVLDIYTLNNKIIISDFKSAFKMIQYHNIEWMDSKLYVEVTEVIRERANEKVQSSKQFQIETKEFELQVIKEMNSIDYHIFEMLDFEIINKDAYVILEINE